MKVKVLKQFDYALDRVGHKVKSCEVGETVDLGDKLANDLAEIEYVAICAPENKRVAKAPETKSPKAPKKKTAGKSKSKEA